MAASKKILAQRLLYFTRNSSSQALTDSRISGLTRMRRSKPRIAPGPGDSGICRRFLHKRAFVATEVAPAVSAGGSLVERLKELNLSKDRIRLDGVLPPAPKESPAEFPTVTVEEVSKLWRAAEIEIVKSKLREIGKNWVPYSEFVRVCEQSCSDPGQAIRVANMLDESGNVIVLGKFVCLRPEQVTKTVAGLIPTHGSTDDDERKQELEKLETIKSEIDKKADELVRRELWAGLGFLMAQTIGFFRLTFWELSWDVMEPICFYVTSTYFMAGYAFFLRTSKEPSFEGFYKSRFETKQKRLMELRNFDIDRYNELQKIFCPMISRSESNLMHMG